MKNRWMRWVEHPLFTHSEQSGSALRLSERALASAGKTRDVDEFVRGFIAEIPRELGVQWGALVRRSPGWSIAAEHGRCPFDELPTSLLTQVLDREAAGFTEVAEPASWGLIAVPIPSESRPGNILLVAGRGLADSLLSPVLGIGRAFGLGIDSVSREEQQQRQAERLQSLLKIASSFASIKESRPLLELIAKEATTLLDCERASIFQWNRDHGQVIACPALGVEGGTLRLPDNVGIVGEVIHNNRTIRVDDAYTDPRFDRSVDKSSGFKTRNLLCQPLRNPAGQLIGAFEVLNKNEGRFTEEDEETLTQLGLHAAIALENTREREQLIRSRDQLTERVTRGVQLVGESAAIVALRSTIDRLAATDLPVLILGESGTGKDVVAQSLHYRGPRASQPFVAVNCAALTESLLESELFGHEKGAFTDAREPRQGKFELADGGTLFLDEIGDMSPGGQAKLLRVLEQKVVTRVGGSQAIPVNVRVVAATNANLAESVAQKKFREDLYYRLSVVHQTMPPLRERAQDILPLAEYFLKDFSARAGRPSLKLAPDARRRLQSHSWPGNVRELKNLMERVAFLAAGERVEESDVLPVLSPGQSFGREPSADMSLDMASKHFQREFIRRAIKRVQNNMSEAARLLGVHRSNLYRKMRQLEMQEVGGAE
ncbi:MAG: sigma 54-interacting transcriptional regulator [Planctomycetaceae bacterium]